MNFEVVYASHEHPKPYVYAAFQSRRDADDYCRKLIEQAFEYDKLNIWVRERKSEQ